MTGIGPAVAHALTRAYATGQRLPQIVAIEADPGSPAHLALIAQLLATCDPTPATSKALKPVLAPDFKRPGRASSCDRVARWNDDRLPSLGGLLRRLRCRPRPRLARAVVGHILETLPRTSEERQLARKVLAVAIRILHGQGSAIYAGSLAIFDMFTLRAPLSFKEYARAARRLEGREREFAALAMAVTVARRLAASPSPERARHHAAVRAERLARTLGMRRLAANARCLRRRVAWSVGDEHLQRVLYRASRALVLSGASATLAGHTGDLVWNFSSSARLSATRTRQVISLLQAATNGAGVSLGLALTVLGPHHANIARHTTLEKRDLMLAIELLGKNRFLSVARSCRALAPRTAFCLTTASLGLVDRAAAQGPAGAVRPGLTSFLPWLWTHNAHDVCEETDRGSWTRHATVDLACLRIMQGKPVEPGTRRLLWNALQVETEWGRRLVIGMCTGSLHLRRGDARRAAIAAARVADAYHGFERLRRRQKIDEKPKMIADYEAHCANALAAFTPPVRAGSNPVRALVHLSRKLHRRLPMRPRLTVDALDALITAGQDAPGPDLEARVIDQLGRMLRARVLMHRAGGRYLQLEAQDVHTLSSWTVLRLARTRRIRAHRIRPRPEYWRPDQRRPGGVLAFPIGTGVAALARKVPFAEKEIQAVRTVLRFLASRRPPSPTDSHAVRRQRTHTTMPESRVKGLVGSSRAWSRVLQQVWRIAPSGCSVLLRGETGTGKELIARAIHYGSPRAGAPFVAINCAALNPETFLAELFGHIRGAFTGADRSRDGIVRSAHRGTLFLDELGDMPIPMQVALLRLLEDRLVRPVGSARTHRVDVRIVSATNRNLESLMRSGHFRQDLYHRLNVMEIDLPPLRSRIEDLPELAEHLLARTPHAASLHMDALSALAEHHWPGNVRELDNVLQAAALLSDGDVVTPEVVRGILAGRRTPPAPASPRLPPRAERILELLGTQWRSAPALAAALMVSTRTVNRDLQSLLRAGLVERSGDARASRYRRAGSVWRDVAGFARN